MREFPREILRPPRSVAQTMYKDIRRWSVMPRGGHFAAMEQPEALAREIVEFFRPLRAQARSTAAARRSGRRCTPSRAIRTCCAGGTHNLTA